MRTIPNEIKTALYNREHLVGDLAPNARVIFLDKSGNNIIEAIDNINIDFSESAFTQSCSFEIINVNPNDPKDWGYYSPMRNAPPYKPQNDWYREIIPSRNIKVEMGYGSHLVSVFVGIIDEIDIHNEVDNYTITVSCRDKLGKALEKYVHNQLDTGIERYYLEYPIPADYHEAWLAPGLTNDPAIEDVVKDLLARAGIPSADIVCDVTGQTWSGEFEKITFSDAINQLKDITNFTLHQDEDGIVHFSKPQGRELSRTGNRVMTGYNLTDPFNYQIAEGANNIQVINPLGQIEYEKGVDYEVDYLNNGIRRIAGTSIPNGNTVKITYVNCDYIFKHGKNIFSHNYKLSHEDMYGSIFVEGSGGEAWRQLQDGFNWDGSYISIEKTLFVEEDDNADNLDTQEKIDTMADRLFSDMKERYMQSEANVVPVPWLQMFDLVQFYIYGTISEVYKIIGYNLTYSVEDGMNMDLRTYHYANFSL